MVRSLVPNWDRFFDSVNMESDCWVWQGKHNPTGYGYFTITHSNFYSHRLMYQLATGQAIPDGLCICHKCNNPPCVNPEHLYLGTQSINLKQAYAQGRKSKKGELASLAKLTWPQVREIRRKYEAFSPRDGLVPQLAEEYGVKPRTIYWVLSGGTWHE